MISAVGSGRREDVSRPYVQMALRGRARTGSGSFGMSSAIWLGTASPTYPLRMNRWTRLLVGVLFGVGCVALVTAVIFGLREVAPVLGLGVLYLFAVLPVAILFGVGYAAAVSVLSMLAFNWFFLPPAHTLSLRDSENWVVLAVYLLTAIIVSELAARARRRAADAEQREREANVLARASAALLRADEVAGEIRAIAEDTAHALGAESGR